jgi:hypothetical protein
MMPSVSVKQFSAVFEATLWIDGVGFRRKYLKGRKAKSYLQHLHRRGYWLCRSCKEVAYPVWELE